MKRGENNGGDACVSCVNARVVVAAVGAVFVFSCIHDWRGKNP